MSSCYRMVSATFTAIVLATTFVRCTTNNLQSAPGADAGELVTADELCTKLSRLSCGQSIAACNADFEKCTGSDESKQSMLDCMNAATFSCTGTLPTTSSCATETANACPGIGTPGDASAPRDASADVTSPPPSGVCNGLCAPGVAYAFACTDSNSSKTTVTMTVGNDGTAAKTPACVDAYGLVYRCDQTLMDFSYYASGLQVGSWALDGKKLQFTRQSTAYTCVRP